MVFPIFPLYPPFPNKVYKVHWQFKIGAIMAEDMMYPKELCELLKGEFEVKEPTRFTDKSSQICKLNKNVNVDIELSFAPRTKPMLYVKDMSGIDLIDIEFPYDFEPPSYHVITDSSKSRNLVYAHVIFSKSHNLILRKTDNKLTMISGKIDGEPIYQGLCP